MANNTVLTSSTQQANFFKRIAMNITNAQLITMYSAPMQIIPAPGAGNLIENVSVTYEFAIGTVSFLLGGNIVLGYGPSASPPSFPAGSAAVPAATLTGNTGTVIIRPVPTVALVEVSTAYINAGIYLGNLTQNFTQVGGLGTGRIMITYQITSGW